MSELWGTDAGPPGQVELRDLIRGLSTPSAVARRRASELVERLDAEGVAGLVQAWRDARVLHPAIDQALLTCGAAAVPPLIEGLGDGYWAVRMRAATLLRDLGDARAAGPLAQLLEDSVNAVRCAAAAALETVGDATCIRSLFDVLCQTKKARPSSPAHQFRMVSVLALGQILARHSVASLPPPERWELGLRCRQLFPERGLSFFHTADTPYALRSAADYRQASRLVWAAIVELQRCPGGGLPLPAGAASVQSDLPLAVTAARSSHEDLPRPAERTGNEPGVPHAEPRTAHPRFQAWREQLGGAWSRLLRKSR